MRNKYDDDDDDDDDDETYLIDNAVDLAIAAVICVVVTYRVVESVSCWFIDSYIMLVSRRQWLVAAARCFRPQHEVCRRGVCAQCPLMSDVIDMCVPSTNCQV